MTKPKAITDKGIMIFKDYEFIFNLISDEEAGKVIKLLINNFGKKYKHNPTDDCKVNNAYNYIVNRINDYQEKSKKASLDGKRGGNPTLKGKVKDKVNGEVKLREGKGIEYNIIEYINTLNENNTFKDYLLKWLKYRKDLKKKEQWEYQYKQLIKFKNYNEVVDNSIGMGYKGLFEPKQSQVKKELNIEDGYSL